MPINKLTRESLTPIADRMPAKGPRSPKSPRQSPRRNVNNLYPQLEDEDVEQSDAADDDDDDYDNTENEDDKVSDIENKDGDSIDEPDGARRKRRPRGNRNVKPSPQQEKVKPKANVNKDKIYPDLPEQQKYPRIPKQQQTPACSESSGNLYYKLMLVLGIVCIITGIVCLILFKPQSDSVSQTGPQFMDYYKLFKPKLDGLRKIYPSQTERFWKVIGAALRRLLNTEIPTYPAIIILSIPRGFSKVGTCLAKEISNNLNSFFNQSYSSYINTLTLDSTSPPKTKLDLDKRLINALESTKSVVIDHMETLHGSVALLFHGYCDGDNAPYKSSAIIFVLHTGVDVDALTEYYVEAELTRRWGGHLGVDEMPALLSRIANNIALVNPEEAEHCQL